MATLKYLLDVTAPDAKKTFDQIGVRMADLDKSLQKTRDLSIGDRQAMATFTRLQAQADRFRDKISGMPLTIEGAAKAEAQLLGLEATADRVDKKLGGKGLGGGDGGPGFIRRLFPGAGGGAGGILGGIGTAGGSLAGAGGPALYGGLGTLAALLTPALLPVLLGGGVGALGAGGALLAGSRAQKQLAALQAKIPAGNTKADQQLRAQLQARIAAFRQANAPALGVQAGFAGVGETGIDTLIKSLTSRGAGFSAGPGGQQGAPSFLTSLGGILKQIGGFIKSIGPSLGDLFRSSVPYLKLFVGFLEQATKTLLPVFSSLLKQFTPYLPLIATGLQRIVLGFAGFLKALGPQGMQASAKIFVVATKVIQFALTALGVAINWLAKNIPVWVHDVAKWWDWLRHDTANVFDGIRHDVAHYWDMTWNNTIGTLIRFGHDVEKIFDDFRHRTAVVFDGARHDIAHVWDQIYSNSIGRVINLVTDIHAKVANFRHDTANVFDGIRHDIASTWDTIWNNTVGRAIRGVQDVQKVIRAIPGWLEGFFKAAGSWLIQGGKNIITGLWNGIKAIWNSVIGWLKGLPGAILKALGIASPPAWAIDAGKHIMGGITKGLKLGAGDVLKFVAGLGGKIGNLAQGFLFNTVEPPGALARFGNAGTGPASIVELAQKMAAARGWSSQWGDINAVEMAEAGWNLTARNPSSGAYGIAQFINGPGEYAQYGGNATTAEGQITAFYNYIAQRYGSPAAAWAHESRYHWYDQGGWLMPGTTVAVNNTGRPEQILPPGGGQDVRITLEVKTGRGASALDRAIVDIIKQSVRICGGGDVQAALGG